MPGDLIVFLTHEDRDAMHSLLERLQGGTQPDEGVD
jgi:hypothetical protein